MERSLSLTEGHVHSTMLRFALPFLLANLLQALYGAADLLIVGQFSTPAQLSAVATGSQVLQTVTSLVSGLTTGGTILLGQYIGMSSERDVKQTVSTMMSLFAIVALGLMAILFAATIPLVSLLQTPEAAVPYTRAYVYICSGGVFFIFGYNAISAMLRGMGDSKRPLYFIAIACVCNIVGDLVLVGVFHMGAAGAAIATVASQGISMLLAIVYLIRKKFLFDFKPKSFRLYREKVSTLLRLGLPVSFQDTLVNISFLFITAIVNHMGVIASAALGVVGKINTFTMLPPTAFSAALAAMVAQNMGAGKQNRAKQCMKHAILLSLCFGVACFVLVQLWPAFFARIFTSDAAVIAGSTEYLRSFSFDFILVCFMFCLNGFFNGCGRTVFSMANNLSSTFFIRVPIAFIVSRVASESLFAIGFAAPLASLFSIVVAFLYLRTGRWQHSALHTLKAEDQTP